MKREGGREGERERRNETEEQGTLFEPDVFPFDLNANGSEQFGLYFTMSNE